MEIKFEGAYDGDEEYDLELVAASVRGDWIVYKVVEAKAKIYGPGLRVVDFTLIVAPLHDQSRFWGEAQFMARARWA